MVANPLSIKRGNNMLEMVCDKLGVEIGEVWHGNDGFLYKIRADGLIEVVDPSGVQLDASAIYWEDIFTGLLKPTWKPKVKDIYYVPDIRFSDDYFGFRVKYWENSDEDNFYYDRNLASKTKDEAIECSYKILELVDKYKRG